MEPSNERRGTSAVALTPKQYFDDQISRIIASHPEKVAMLKQRAIEAKNFHERENELKGQAETFVAFVMAMSELGIIERRSWSSATELHDLVEAISHYKFETG